MKSNLIKIRNVFFFLTSLILTLAVGTVAISYLVPQKSATAVVATYKPDKNVRILFSDIDGGANYEIETDFIKKEVKTKSLNFDNGVYNKSGLSALIKEAGKNFQKFDKTIAVTSTRFAALIDKIGGTPLDVDTYHAEKYGTGNGYGMLNGITAVKFFADEEENRVDCLRMMQNIASNWYKILKDKENFFALLNLSDSDLSYTDYLKVQKYFG